MGFKAHVFNVMIASPSDLTDERKLASDAIHEWNDLNASAEGIVLLPLLWESHSTPEVGDRPQAIINRQLVDRADLLIGLFWTKLGTPTGVADSGTVEEIQKMINDGKQVMLYFSDRKLNPSKFDAKQMKRLKDFKSDIFKTAVAGKFESHDELRRKVTNDLTRRVREMKAALSATAEKQQPANSSGEAVDLQVKSRRDPRPENAHMRWLSVDLTNWGVDLHDVRVVFMGHTDGGLGFNFPLDSRDQLPNPFKKGQSRRFMIGNPEPHKSAYEISKYPLNKVFVVVFSGVREVARITAEEFKDELDKWDKPDLSLPPKPPEESSAESIPATNWATAYKGKW